MYAMQYGELLYFTETPDQLYGLEPDALIEIDALPEYGPGYSVKIDLEKKQLVPVKIREQETNVRTNIFEDAINLI